MSRNWCKTALFIAGLCLAVGWPAFGQNFPFPQNIDYGFGHYPSTATNQDALDAYNEWRAGYLTECRDGTSRVKWDSPNQTVSEGIGYGMLLTAYYGDKTDFDRLYAYYLKYPASPSGFMNWKIRGCDGAVVGEGSATDGDLDVALALLVASDQWGGTYFADAVDMIGRIQQFEVEQGCGVPDAGLRGGAFFGGCEVTNASYFSPAYYRVFAIATGDTFWDQFAADTYTALFNNAHPVTGLPSDWQDVYGNPGADSVYGWPYDGFRYAYDAARTPWRIALDHLWWGTADSQMFNTKITNWVDSFGIANVVDGYFQDGSAYGSTHNATFVGGFAVGSTAVDQARSDAFNAELVNVPTFTYFNSSLKALYLLASTGNFWRPSGIGDPGNPPPPPPNGDDLISNGTFDSTADWTLEINGSANGQFTVPGGEGYIKVSRPGKINYELQLKQLISIESGTTYNISFKARAARARTMTVVVQDFGSPFATYFEQVINLDTTQQSYGPFPLTSPVTSSLIKLTFMVGGERGDVYLDDVAMVRQP